MSKRKSKKAKRPAERPAERAANQAPVRKPEQLSLGVVEASAEQDRPAEPAEPDVAVAEAPEPAEPAEPDVAVADAPEPERSAEPAEPAEPAGATDEQQVVTELVNAHDGCWMRLANGEKVELTDKQWRQEMSRLIARKHSRQALG